MSIIDKAISFVGVIAEDFVLLHQQVAEHPEIKATVDRIHRRLNVLLDYAASVFGPRIKDVAVLRSGGNDKPPEDEPTIP
ncbi:hypothetical protein HOU02_gp427 [Caulobacter phage CcrBL9]|uniref:Uncharacterized protein n=1 Tax=Caulobacter phage CcrBL9 TaxID=2283270 RepID=A0A385EEV4_9CAUD|nr:hypothetical protein HOU02_gp427 [Caulobacter phage CcrBL9]AXQ69298.1 hypothetical protein CcrBL9_gp274c [Caulobacter phage CcrBL9]